MPLERGAFFFEKVVDFSPATPILNNMIAGKLTFQFGNAKLNETIATFSLPSGWTCPMALECLSKANRNTGRMTDGSHTKFRCFSASQEAVFTTTRDSRWYNLDMLKAARTQRNMRELICNSLPLYRKISKVRIHVAGDFFSETYFRAWLDVAAITPELIFYGYTKRISLLIKRRLEFPSNFRFVASLGGKEDNLIFEHGLKYARVVFSEQEAADLGLELDHEDDHAYSEDNKPFALLLHGTQPKGTPAAEAWKIIKREGKGYNIARRKAREKAETQPVFKIKS